MSISFFSTVERFSETYRLLGEDSPGLKRIIIDEFDLPKIGRVDYVLGLYDP